MVAPFGLKNCTTCPAFAGMTCTSETIVMPAKAGIQCLLLASSIDFESRNYKRYRIQEHVDFVIRSFREEAALLLPFFLILTDSTGKVKNIPNIL